MKLKIISILFFLQFLGYTINIFATDISILMKDGSGHTINLSSVESIYYNSPGELLQLNFSDGTTQNFAVSEIHKMTFENTVGITERELEILKSFSLLNNFPNPFNPHTTITYELKEPASVSINVYDAVGRFVRNIERGERSAGQYSVSWNGKNEDGITVSSGVYFYRLETESYTETKQMLLLK